jgi:hypothetical protein
MALTGPEERRNLEICQCLSQIWGSAILPSVGQVPRRWKVCADTALTSRAAAAPIDVVDFMANASKSVLYKGPWKDAIASNRKLPRPGFIAPRASDLHVELLAVSGHRYHMGRLAVPGYAVHPRGLVACDASKSVNRPLAASCNVRAF